ncbi:hypothetical protein [Dyella sp.]|uniref:hypothetical protein n=1 Tax=Dyella sp. TaxID=1869338 RepID=UPI002FD8F65F
MSNVIQLHATNAAKAAGVFEATLIAAKRMGYSIDAAQQAAGHARNTYNAGQRSPARIIADSYAQLRQNTHQVCA